MARSPLLAEGGGHASRCSNGTARARLTVTALESLEGLQPAPWRGEKDPEPISEGWGPSLGRGRGCHTVHEQHHSFPRRWAARPRRRLRGSGRVSPPPAHAAA